MKKVFELLTLAAAAAAAAAAPARCVNSKNSDASVSSPFHVQN